MRKQLKYSKYLVAAILILAVELAYGSFTGKTGNDSERFSLRNLNSNRTFSLSSLHTNTFRYKGTSNINQQNNGQQVQVQSMIRLERGNTTYVYPYKYTVKVPKFVAPKAPASR
jgi:hypothetical protein